MGIVSVQTPEGLGLPLFGTFVTMGERNWNGEDDAPIGAGLTLAGLYQNAGIAMFIIGLTLRRTRTERNFAVTPIVSDDALGLRLQGSF